MLQKLIMEIEQQRREWREMILSVCRKNGVPNAPKVNCPDEDEWFDQIEHLSYLILWDYDFEDEDLYIDIPPEASSQLKEFMRIKDDYFLGIPDDLRETEIAAQMAELKSMCRLVCEDKNSRHR